MFGKVYLMDLALTLFLITLKVILVCAFLASIGLEQPSLGVINVNKKDGLFKVY